MRNLFGEEISTRKSRGTKGPRKAKVSALDCSSCPLDKVPGINKVINIEKVTGRRAFLWAQGPGRTENQKGLELIGAAGEFLWKELAEFGIDRSVFDIQNIERCYPSNGREEFEVTSKEFKQAVKCCSHFNQEALDRNRGQAQVHLILGKVAGTQLLGKAYNKTKAAIWYEPWNAYVVIAEHPLSILRRGGRKAGWAYFAFRDRLKALKAILDHPSRWGYVKAQDYGAVETPEEAAQLKAILHAEAKAGRRVSVDIEDGEVKGKKVILMVGFSWGRFTKKSGDFHGDKWRKWEEWDGQARSVVLEHPEASKKHLPALWAMVKEVLEDPTISKILQHGSYDFDQLRDLKKIRLRGYEFDTQYGTYLKYSHLRTYSLDSQAGYFYPEFADYKTMCGEWSGNFADVPLDTLVTYNCADADLTKRIEARTTKISLPLLQVYINTAFTLEDMETRGPILDREAHARVSKIVDAELEKLLHRVRQVAGDPEFNPNTPQQVATLLFDKLRLPMLAGRSTGKEVMELLTIRTESKVPQLIQDYRALSKVKGTCLVGQERSANAHNGMLHTHWYLTGAATGRLRSGGEKGDDTCVNLQNLHGSAILKNLLVSDENWRLALEE